MLLRIDVPWGHGSVNWEQKVSNINGNLWYSPENLNWTGEFTTDKQNKQSSLEIAHAPAIAIPTISKTSFEMPLLHLDQLKNTIHKTNKLIIIGWRGAEEHFLKIWNDKIDKIRRLEKIYIVGRNEITMQKTYTLLKNKGNICTDSPVISKNGFSKFTSEELDEILSIK